MSERWHPNMQDTPDGDLIGDRAIDADDLCPHAINVYLYCETCSTPCACHGYPYFDCPNEKHRQHMNSMAGIGACAKEGQS